MLTESLFLHVVADNTVFAVTSGVGFETSKLQLTCNQIYRNIGFFKCLLNHPW